MNPGLQVSHVKTMSCVDVQIPVRDKILRIREARSSRVDRANRYPLKIDGYGAGGHGRHGKLREKISHLRVSGQCINGRDSSARGCNGAGADLLSERVELISAVEERPLF